MTEQEIVDYLKQNRIKGVAFAFMPKEVQDWCCNRPNYFNDFLLYKNGAWRDEYCFVNPAKDLKEIALEEIIILALPYSFQIKQEPQSGWVEFEIDQRGNFHCFINNDMHYFFWANWNVFLTEADSFGYTAFGGWLYDKSGGGDWVLSPQVGLIDDSGNAPFILNRYSHTYEKERITPAIPIKIRFWRESK